MSDENQDKAAEQGEEKASELAKKGEQDEDDPNGAAAVLGIPEDILNRLPKPQREVFESTFLAMQMGSAPSPIARSIKPEHVTALISNAEKNAERQATNEDKQNQREADAYKRGQTLLFGACLGFLHSWRSS